MNHAAIPLFVITPEVINSPLQSWLENNRAQFYEKLYQQGGILLRGFNLHSVSEFNNISQLIAPNLLDYMYQSSPRTRVGGKIYTSTEYPMDQTISLHSENSYSNCWPSLIMFFAVMVADEGGQTPIAYNQKIYTAIPEELRKKFMEHGILYVRNYRSGLDLSWQTVFQTEDKVVVEDYCHKNSIKYEWRSNDELRTEQVCQAVTEHPVTKELLWFNQAHLFHISSLNEHQQSLLYEKFSKQELPRNTYYGDGSEIDTKDLEVIRQIYLQEKFMFDWQKGDIMVLDNLLMCHGREPYKGNRKIVVAMA